MIATATVGDSTAAPATAETWTVIYDEDCGLCRTLLAPLLRADSARRLRPLALGAPEADRLLADLSVEQRNASWHLVDPAGRRTSAGAAAPPLLRLLPHGALPAALLARVPGTTERAYRFVAEHRSPIGRLVPSAAKRRATGVLVRRTAETAADG
jgi:predicted DCC family thiol-disulfide oxidoreductase YuxK